MCSSDLMVFHHFNLDSAYEPSSSPIMPYTNYTSAYEDRFSYIITEIFSSSCRSDFRGIIDYVFYAKQLMRVLGVLGPLDPEWIQTNKIVGCPHPGIPSDHFSLLVEFELNPPMPDHGSTSIIPRRS